MENENTALATIEAVNTDMTLSRDPRVTLADAERSAEALKNQLFKKLPPPIINGKQYPTVEHWQTAGSFYGIFPKVVEVRYVQYGDVVGFEAVAEAVNINTGMVVSRAEAMCLTDEARWKGRPLHQIKAMAQTRACSRVLRNVLSRIMVLAGCEATPAEEMDGTEQHGFADEKAEIQPTQRASGGGERHKVPGKKITEPQRKRFFAIWKGAGWSEATVKHVLQTEYSIEHSQDILMDDYEAICERFSQPPGGGNA